MIDFWFTMGSTYTCLTALRLGEVARSTGIEFRWRPFHLLTLLQAKNYMPFADPAKLAYMWRDIDRRAAMYGFPLRVPAPYPVKNSAFANRVAIVGMGEGWGPNFVCAAYRRWFQLGEETGSELNVVNSLREVGQEYDRVAAAANSTAGEKQLEAETDTARQLGIFGSPTFAVSGQLFWGDDRLNDAIGWRQHGTLAG